MTNGKFTSHKSTETKQDKTTAEPAKLEETLKQTTAAIKPDDAVNPELEAIKTTSDAIKSASLSDAPEKTDDLLQDSETKKLSPDAAPTKMTIATEIFVEVFSEIYKSMNEKQSRV